MDPGALTAASVVIANTLANQMGEEELIVLTALLSMIAETLDTILELRELKSLPDSKDAADAHRLI